MKILYVDDIGDNRELVRDILEFSGYEPVLASDGNEALEILRKESIQFVITDWMMPQLTGTELVEKIREEFADNYIYTMLISARGERKDVIVGLESGADDFMARPFTPPELLARVAIGRRLVALQNDLRSQNVELARAKQEWEATTNAIPQLICLVDADGQIQRVNGTVERWGLGQVEDVLDQRMADLLRPVYKDFAEEYEIEWGKVLPALQAGKQSQFEGEDYYEEKYFLVHFQPTRSGDNDELENGSSFAVVSIQDITNRKKLELELEVEHQKAENLLLNMLPRSVAERLKHEDADTIAEQFGGVTVLFADLVDFTPLTASISPGELIDLLNSVFSAFDMLAERNRVEKIKTIGDAYMVVGGLPEPAEDHAQRIARMALAMMRAIERINEAYGYRLRLRIGVHSGPVVAGVIGMKKLTYDLWGETVNTASRMESSGKVGFIQVSTPTYELLKDEFEFDERGIIDVKGIGEVQTYFLTGEKE